MALVLDTETLPELERAEAVRSAMRYARVPALLTHETDHRVYARVDVWDLGAATTLLHRTSSGIRLRRTPQQVRRIAEDRFGFVVLSPGRWSFDQRREHRQVQTDRWDVLVVDHSAPYEFGRYGEGSTYAGERRPRGPRTGAGRGPGRRRAVAGENRGHSITIDSGWREVCDTALNFIRRFA